MARVAVASASADLAELRGRRDALCAEIQALTETNAALQRTADAWRAAVASGRHELATVQSDIAKAVELCASKWAELESLHRTLEDHKRAVDEVVKRIALSLPSSPQQ